MMETDIESFADLREQIVGMDTWIDTPYGRKLMLYADYTASGRCLRSVEKEIRALQSSYANTHTEDDFTGREMSRQFHDALNTIKAAVRADDDYSVIACGSGATAAIEKLQQLLGVFLPPATAAQMFDPPPGILDRLCFSRWQKRLNETRPVVFVGPYEHHSNEISWRQSLAEVVPVNLADDGSICLEHLEQLLKAPAYQSRLRIGSFSAASNVTGMKSQPNEIACLLHRYDALACFDYAASGPYVQIEMNPEDGRYEGDGYLDAIYLSPHKFLGGPGSSGLLIFRNELYRTELPPSVSGGGTVSYVGPHFHDYHDGIEAREQAGTPPILQLIRAARAMEVKVGIGEATIEQREHEVLEHVFERWGNHPSIEILGNQDPGRRVGIVSFNLKAPDGKYLHPKFVTVVLNDLFGIQSRAGCSCAGPYGHRLLGIDDVTSDRYRAVIASGFEGIKPGWCRVSFHYAMDESEVTYLVDVVEFLARHGHRLLVDYQFDVRTGQWTHKTGSKTGARLVNERLMTGTLDHQQSFRNQLQFAEALVASYCEQLSTDTRLAEGLDELRYFSLRGCEVVGQ